MVKRSGFTLVEVLVAATLLAVGVLSLAASGTLAASLIGTAQRDEEAARLAGTLLDSLVLVPEPGHGTSYIGNMVAQWSGAAGGTITMTVRYGDSGRPRVRRWTASSLSRLQAMPPAPGATP